MSPVSITGRLGASAVILTAAIGALLAFAAGSASAVPASRPNILWITAEDLSPDLGCYGDAYARTPNLDRFAAEGARFTRAFSVAPVCAPSRSSIITGMYPTTIGTHHMRSKGVPPPYVRCFSEYLRAAGYYCTNNAKTDYNFDSPVTAWDESSGRAHWRGREKGQPFFAVFNINTTHESQIRTEPQVFARQTRSLAPSDRHDPAKAVLPPYYPDTPIVRNDWARYHDLITAMDLQAGDLLRQLDEDGLAGNTVVLFYGDHGRGLPRAKRWVYDSGIHVPLLVRWPGKIAPGTLREELVSFIDLAPTVLSIAGIRPPSHLQGRPFLGERRASERTYVYAHRDRMDETYDIIRCVRDRRASYIRNFQPGKPYAQYIDYMELMPTMREMRRVNKEGTLAGAQKIFFMPEKPAEELYDTVSDPHQVVNLAGQRQHNDTLRRMRRELDRWMKETRDLGLVPEDQLKERMRPGGKWATTAEPVLKAEPAGGSGGVRVTATCSTEGASLAYAVDSGSGAAWKLYTGPVLLLPSERRARLRAKACRLGYLDSREVTYAMPQGP